MLPTTTLDKSQQIADELGSILQRKDFFTSVTKYVGQRSNLVSLGELQPNEGSYLLGFSVVFTPEEQRDRLRPIRDAYSAAFANRDNL